MNTRTSSNYRDKSRTERSGIRRDTGVRISHSTLYWSYRPPSPICYGRWRAWRNRGSKGLLSHIISIINLIILTTSKDFALITPHHKCKCFQGWPCKQPVAPIRGVNNEAYSRLTLCIYQIQCSTFSTIFNLNIVQIQTADECGMYAQISN